MKKHWLRGVLLGVSLALLLAGGVALAQALMVTVDKGCVQCWEGPLPLAPQEARVQPFEPPPDEYTAWFTASGMELHKWLCFQITANDQVVAEPQCPLICEDTCLPSYGVGVTSLCDGLVVLQVGRLDSGAGQLSGPSGLGPLYGEWRGQFWQQADGVPVVPERIPAVATFTLARDCAALEFVPEPGTILLLGSGLVGLAGYAGLRWRTRE